MKVQAIIAKRLLATKQQVLLSSSAVVRLTSSSSGGNTAVAAASNSAVKQSFNSIRPRRFNLWPTSKVGLFQVPELTTPEGFIVVKDAAITKGWELLDAANECEPGEETIRLFDELSDTLCRVADLSDFIKSSHPDEAFAEAAAEAHLSIGTMVEELNTNTKLFSALRRVTDDQKVRASLDDDTRTVADLFMADFEISGINMEATERQRAVELHECLLQLVGQFMQSAHTPVVLPNNYVPESMRHCFPQHDSNHVIMRSLHYDNPNEEVREFAYKVYYHNQRQAEDLLSRLLSTRYELAKLLGYSTYSERALASLTVSDPNKILDFLYKLSKKLKPYADADYKKLSVMKANDFASRRCNSAVVQPWDVPLYSSRLRAENSSVDHSQYSAYFSLGDCMAGLDNLFKSLYGVTFSTMEPERGETWSDDVKKLAVKQANTGNVMGYIYCDFFQRAGKPQQDCHYTIRGGRRLRDGSYQLPVVVLMLNLNHPTAHRPTLLSSVTIGNLFHEMGHAMHSMLARTRYQHVTGTRCATDFAEVPSILMEYFVNDPRVLSSFARHHQTGEPISESMLQELRKSNAVGVAFETQTQVYYSIMDQLFHGKFDGSTSTHAVLKQIENEHACVAAVDHGAWHHRFGHLAAYGAKYHAYLMSRAIASQIWTSCFQANPFDGKMGAKYRNEMLRHGGGKSPAKMYESMLGEKLDISKLADTLVEDLKFS